MQNQCTDNFLDRDSLHKGVSVLTELDADLKQVITKVGHPPLWSRDPGYSTLIRIILEQQVSLASAEAVFTKLSNAAGPDQDLTPSLFLEFSDADLKTFGFSRQKATYGREVSKQILNGSINLDALHHMNDSDAKQELMSVKGIGPWTANIYLMMALMRPDVWPSGDLALKKAIQEIKDLREMPGTETADHIALQWKPWRAVATRILWHYYLSDSYMKN